jgi:protoporphyrinogen oxidase
LHKNKLQPLPDGLAMMIPTNVLSILKSRSFPGPGKCAWGLIFCSLPQRSARREPRPVYLTPPGREAYENLIEPLMSGIYAGDGDQLSLRSTFPYLHDLEHKYGSLARGALKMRQQMAARGGSTQGSRSAFLTPPPAWPKLSKNWSKPLTLRSCSRIAAQYEGVLADANTGPGIAIRGTWKTGETLETRIPLSWPLPPR